MSRLQGKTVLITGAGGGFGREMIKQFAAAGSRLILSDVSSEMLETAVADSGIDELLLVGLVVADLGQPAGAQSLHDDVTKLNAPVDILVNNAGIAMSGNFEDLPTERWETLMQINLLAPMRLTQCVLPGMLERGHGHIVNVSSVAGLVGVGQLAPYSSAKFGLRGFGAAMADELKPRGVYVSNIYPFFARTPILDSERFGDTAPSSLPENLIYDPAFIVAKLIQGIEKNRLHIYPGWIPRIVLSLNRHAPWLLQRLL